MSSYASCARSVSKLQKLSLNPLRHKENNTLSRKPDTSMLPQARMRLMEIRTSISGMSSYALEGAQF